MRDKSPKKANNKKAGKSLKERREEKRVKVADKARKPFPS